MIMKRRRNGDDYGTYVLDLFTLALSLDYSASMNIIKIKKNITYVKLMA